MLKNGSKKGFLIVKLRFAFLPTAFIVYWILVHYRVGSLEMLYLDFYIALHVHYRVGSLEKFALQFVYLFGVHYRVGSLEKTLNQFAIIKIVHYRVGFLVSN